MTVTGAPPPPLLWRTSRRTLVLSGRPLIMGILNLTPDSFSDGGLWNDPERAVAHALTMVEEGADIIDIGGESSRPGAAPVSEEEELRRIMPLLERLVPLLNVPLSIDTTKAAVARRSLAAGAEIINDISGLFFDEGMADVVAAGYAGLVVMHSRGTPDQMQLNTRYADLVGEVRDGLRASLGRALAAGISAEQVVIDPGIGFAKDRAGNLRLLRSLGELLDLGRPLLVGASRKGFTGTAAGRLVENRLFTTAATVALAVAQGAALLRVHDVAAMRAVADMAWEISGEQS